MELMREVVETFIRLWKSEVSPNAVLVSADDMFEVVKSPSLILQGPTVTEDLARRTLGKSLTKHPDDLIYEECNHPRLYHLDFDVIVTTAAEGELLDLMEKAGRFYQNHPVLTLDDHGSINLTELVPVGGLRRVNLSNMRQASGRCRIEDCPIYDGRVTTGPLVAQVLTELKEQEN